MRLDNKNIIKSYMPERDTYPIGYPG